MATYSSILVWRIPWMGGAWRATVHGVARSQTQLSNQHIYASLFKTWLNPSQRPLLRCAEEPRVRPVGKPTPLCPSRGSVSPPLCAPLPLSPSVTFDPCGTISASPGAGKGFLSLLPTGCPARKSISEQAPGSTLGPASPLSMGFSRQEYWSGLPFPSPYT